MNLKSRYDPHLKIHGEMRFGWLWINSQTASREATPSYLLDAGSMVMELLPLQWSQCPTGEIPREAPIPVWDGDVAWLLSRGW